MRNWKRYSQDIQYKFGSQIPVPVNPGSHLLDRVADSAADALLAAAATVVQNGCKTIGK